MNRAEYIFNKIVEQGEAAIDEFIRTRKCEELFLDFKRSATDNIAKSLHDNDRNNLSRAISGFGNSAGGVIVWGIDCSKNKIDDADVAKTRRPIPNVKRFISWIEGAISGCTVPVHDRVQNHLIITNEAADEGIVITFVPESNHAPHQVTNEMKYYIRAGSNFVPTPHAVLAGMFGRRPQPNIIYNVLFTPPKLSGKKIICEFSLLIRNNGPGIAQDIFLNLFSYSPGNNCQIEFIPLSPDEWRGNLSLGFCLSLISKPDIKLPPEAHLIPLNIKLILAPPFSEQLSFKGLCGCSGSPSCKISYIASAETVLRLYNETISQNGSRGTASDLFKNLFDSSGQEKIAE